MAVAKKSNVRKTHLMYRANLSYQQLSMYLYIILKNGLLEERVIDENKFYSMTTKGWQFLTKANEAKELLGNFGDIENIDTTLRSTSKQSNEETIEQFGF